MEDERVRLAHVRLAVTTTAQLLLVGTLPQSPPWLFCFLLLPRFDHGG